MDKLFNSQHINSNYNITLPDRLKRFYDSGEFSKYQFRKLSQPIPGYSIDYPLVTDFTSARLFSILKENGIVFGNSSFYLPIARFYSIKEFLAVDIFDTNYSVYLWSHGSGKFLKISESFDGFLEVLSDDELSILDKLKQSIDNLRETIQSQKTEDFERILLDDSIESDKIFDPKKKFGHHEYEVMDLLGEYFRLRGIVALSLKRYNESVKLFKRSLSYENVKAPFGLLESYWGLNDLNSILRLTTEIESDPFLIGTTSVNFVLNYRLVAVLLTSGFTQDVEKLLRQLLDSTSSVDQLRRLLTESFERGVEQEERIQNILKSKI